MSDEEMAYSRLRLESQFSSKGRLLEKLCVPDMSSPAALCQFSCTGINEMSTDKVQVTLIDHAKYSTLMLAPTTKTKVDIWSVL